MTMQRFTGRVVSQTGDARSNVSVTVNLKSSGTPASIFSDDASPPTAKTNPIVTDGSGDFWFYATDTDYTIESPGESDLGDVTLFSGVDRTVLLYKAAFERVNNSAVLQNDDDLFLTILDGESWDIWFGINFITNGAAHFKYQVSGITMTPDALEWVWLTDDVVTLEPTAAVSGTLYTSANAAADGILLIHSMVFNQDISTTMNFKWAQANADASNTDVLAGSWMNAKRIGVTQ